MFNFFTTTYIGKIIMTMAFSAIPVIELRGGIPFGVAHGLSPWTAFFTCVIGNMIPIPFIILFVRQIFDLLKKSPKIKSLIVKIEKRAHVKADIVRKYSVLGLCIFVAIPLPGTGAWTGALIAALLDMRLKTALPTIFLGVVIAGLIITSLTYGFIQIF